MAKKPNLASALQNASGKPAPVSRPAEPKPKAVNLTQPPPPTTSTPLPPSRQGKKAITGFFDPAVSKQIKQIALDEEKTVQALLSEALNDLFVKYNHKPIA